MRESCAHVARTAIAASTLTAKTEIDALLPLVGLGTRHSRILLAGLKRLYRSGPVRAGMITTRTFRGCDTDPKMTGCPKSLRSILTVAHRQYQFIPGRQRLVDHC
jgi:hypothetical protein